MGAQPVFMKKRFFLNGLLQNKTGVIEKSIGDRSVRQTGKTAEENHRSAYNLMTDHEKSRRMSSIITDAKPKAEQRDGNFKKFELNPKNNAPINQQTAKEKELTSMSKLSKFINPPQQEESKKINGLMVNDSIVLINDRLKRNQTPAPNANLSGQGQARNEKTRVLDSFDEYGITKENSNPNATPSKLNRVKLNEKLKPNVIVHNDSGLNVFKSAKNNFSNLKDSKLLILNNVDSKNKNEKSEGAIEPNKSQFKGLKVCSNQENKPDNSQNSRINSNNRSFVGVNTNLCKQISNKELDTFLHSTKRQNINQRRSYFNPGVKPKKSALKKTKSTISKKVVIAEEKNCQHEVSKWLKEAQHEYSPFASMREETPEGSENTAPVQKTPSMPTADHSTQKTSLFYANPALSTYSFDNNLSKLDSLRNVSSTGIIRKRISLDERKNGSTFFRL